MVIEKDFNNIIWVLLVVLIPFHVTGQDTQSIPPQYFTATIKYFEVEKLLSEFSEDIINEPIVKLIKVYEKHGLMSLSELPRDEWPKEAIDYPTSIMKVKPKLLKPTESFKCATILITELSSNGNTLRVLLRKPDSSFFNYSKNCKERIQNEFDEILKEIEKTTQISSRQLRVNNHINFTIDSDTVSVTKTLVTRDSIQNYLSQKLTMSIEGIYESLDSVGSIYTLGIIKSDSLFNIICLDSNVDYWKEGMLKGFFNLDDIKDEKRITWIMGHRNVPAKPIARINLKGLLELEFNEPLFRRTKYFKKML